MKKYLLWTASFYEEIFYDLGKSLSLVSGIGFIVAFLANMFFGGYYFLGIGLLCFLTIALLVLTKFYIKRNITLPLLNNFNYEIYGHLLVQQYQPAVLIKDEPVWGKGDEYIFIQGSNLCFPVEIEHNFNPLIIGVRGYIETNLIGVLEVEDLKKIISMTLGYKDKFGRNIISIKNNLIFPTIKFDYSQKADDLKAIFNEYLNKNIVKELVFEKIKEKLDPLMPEIKFINKFEKFKLKFIDEEPYFKRTKIHR